MIHAALRSTRTPSFRSSPLLLTSRIATTTSSVRFAQSSADKHPPEDMDMDKDKNLSEKTGDVMSHSFGEGYATRSDEEGFGGIYGGNQSIPGSGEQNEGDNKKKNIIHENHPEYDEDQGSEVKEKEKARHQTHVPTTPP